MKLLGPVMLVLGLVLAFGRGLWARLMGRQRTPAPQTWLDPSVITARAEGAKTDVTKQAEAASAPHLEAVGQIDAEVAAAVSVDEAERRAALRALAERVNR